MQDHNTLCEHSHIVIMFRAFFFTQAQRTVHLWVEQNWCHEVSGSSISIIVVGVGDLHCHSTNLKQGVVNSLCTMHYIKTMKRDEKSWIQEINELFYMTTTLPPHQWLVEKMCWLQYITAYIFIA